MAAEPDGPALLARIAQVSRETSSRLEAHVALLRRWQPVKNLVGPATLPEVWWRHVADSLQLVPLAPGRGRWLDLGSGAGFPGLVIAAALTDPALATDEPPQVHLVESNQRKAAFLREAARAMALPFVTVHAERTETALARIAGPIDVVTARAFTKLADLAADAKPFVDKGAIALFPKGQDVEVELTQAATSWIMRLEKLPSRTDPKATILRISDISPAA